MNEDELVFLKKKIWRPLCQEFYDSSERLAISTLKEYIIDEKNNKIIDLNSSWWVNGLGHRNKKIITDVKKQINLLDSVVFADFLHKPALLLVKKLYQLINKNIIKDNKINKNTFEKFFFADNGSTAIEIAIKIAHQFYINKNITRKNKIISFKGNYHGETFGAMSAGAMSNYFNPFKELFFEVLFLDFPENYLGKNITELEQEENSICKKLESTFTNDTVSSIIIEPIIQGANGMKIARVEFFQKVIKLCKKYNIIIIFDEVMTGFGRTGEMFAFEKIMQNDNSLTPDIIALSKVLTNGLFPFGIVAVTHDIYKPFYSSDTSKTFLHSHSHTANPIICSCALSNLKLLEQDKILNKIKKIEHFIINFANKLYKKNYNIIEKIRFCGTILAFEVNKDKFKTLKNKNFSSSELKEALLKKNIYIRPIDNNIFIIPPYIVSISKLDKYLKLIIDTLLEI